jgi:hypothetical protein
MTTTQPTRIGKTTVAACRGRSASTIDDARALEPRLPIDGMIAPPEKQDATHQRRAPRAVDQASLAQWQRENLLISPCHLPHEVGPHMSSLSRHGRLAVSQLSNAAWARASSGQALSRPNDIDQRFARRLAA